MRVPLTRYGWPQTVFFPALALAAIAVCIWAGPALLPLWATFIIEAVLLIVLIWIFTFFRDPERPAPGDTNLLLAPADGTITNIELVEENDYIAGQATRIGIFLSIFDVHINRSPCNAIVEKVTYRPGSFKNAAKASSGKVNESNDLALLRTEVPKDRLIVRQISGAVARRIVCTAKTGQKLSGGQRFGMIKFGSRTELYVPARENTKCLVQIGNKVKAGLTPLVRYEKV